MSNALELLKNHILNVQVKDGVKQYKLGGRWKSAQEAASLLLNIPRLHIDLLKIGIDIEILENPRTFAEFIEKEYVAEFKESKPDTSGIILAFSNKDNPRMGIGSSPEIYIIDEKTLLRVPGNTSALLQRRAIKNPLLEAIPVIPCYDPTLPPGLKYREGNPEGHVLNTYIPPKWKAYYDEVPGTPPAIVKEFFEHLVPYEEDREYLYYWIGNSLIDICTTWLMLLGSPGIGKNVFRSVLVGLHGMENLGAGKTDMAERFNSALLENTLMFFDEFKWNDKHSDKLKEWPNRRVAIEGKGKDISKGDKIFCSFVMANNNIRAGYVTFEDRKFSPLRLSETRLNDKWDVVKIRNFIHTFDSDIPTEEDLRVVAQTAKWLIKERDRLSHKFPVGEYKGPMFWKVCHAVLSDRSKLVIQLCLSEFVDYKKVREDNMKDGWIIFDRAYTTFFARMDGRKKSMDKLKMDLSICKALLDSYRSMDGRKIFETKEIPETIMGEFLVRAIPGVTEITEEEFMDIL